MINVSFATNKVTLPKTVVTETDHVTIDTKAETMVDEEDTPVQKVVVHEEREATTEIAIETIVEEMTDKEAIEDLQEDHQDVHLEDLQGRSIETIEGTDIE